MKAIWSRLSIKWGMILLFLGISLISMILVGVFSHMNYSRAVKADFHTVTDEAAKRLQYHLEFYFDQVSQSTRTLADFSLIQSWMDNGQELNVFDEEAIEAQLRRSVAFHYSEAVGIFLKSMDGRVLSVPGNSSRQPDYQAEPWYSIPVPEKRILLPTHRIQYPLSQGMSVVSVVMPVYSQTDLSLIGCIVIDLSLREIELTMERSSLGKSGQFMLLSQDGTIVYHPNKEWRGLLLQDTPLGAIDIPGEEQVRTAHYEGRQLLISTSSSRITGWKVVALVPFDEMAKGLYTARNATISAFLVIALLLVLVIPYISRPFVRPIRRLQQSMRRVAQGDYTARAEFRRGYNEFDSLNNSFNLMVQQLDQQVHLIADLKLQELKGRLRQKEAYIQLLQNQINPHLLYNSLDVIKSIGYIGQNDLVVRMAGNLADVYRYMAGISDREVTLQEELAILDKYLDMVHIRSPEAFQSCIEVPQELHGCMVVKLILQPIVENAVKYAVRNEDRDSVIAVRARREQDDLLIDVEDNGKGIPEEKRQELQRLMSAAWQEEDSGEIVQGSSLGISNVHTRLSLKYGAPYGLALSSVRGGGTRVTLRLPLRAAPHQVKKSSDCVRRNWV